MPGKPEGRVLTGQGLTPLAFPLFFGNFSSIPLAKLKCHLESDSDMTNEVAFLIGWEITTVEFISMPHALFGGSRKEKNFLWKSQLWGWRGVGGDMGGKEGAGVPSAAFPPGLQATGIETQAINTHSQLLWKSGALCRDWACCEFTSSVYSSLLNTTEKEAASWIQCFKMAAEPASLKYPQGDVGLGYRAAPWRVSKDWVWVASTEAWVKI